MFLTKFAPLLFGGIFYVICNFCACKFFHFLKYDSTHFKTFRIGCLFWGLWVSLLDKSACCILNACKIWCKDCWLSSYCQLRGKTWCWFYDELERLPRSKICYIAHITNCSSVKYPYWSLVSTVRIVFGPVSICYRFSFSKSYAFARVWNHDWCLM